MKYYEIIIHADLPVTGKYPQVKDLKINFHEARASQWGIISQWKSEDDIPDLNNFVFQKGFKLTDIVTNNFVNISSGIFISEKAKSVFDSFIVNGNFYPISIYESDKKHKYNFLWYEYGAKNKIDYKESIFIEYDSMEERYGEIIPIEDFEDFKIKVKKLYTEKEEWDIVPKSLQFKEYFDITPAFDISLICNEEVKNAIEENRLTGFLFKPVDIEISFK
ncbi:hypothetical protein [Chryseobacterium scophthalmum]|uniref:hypothetical protein n=1 Tax=Chryseobacterium scophthalmum TaxID=59733 RepID=UPI001AEBBCA5|nr:hypothetical protein [Chryseobacterium scophthalmum]